MSSSEDKIAENRIRILEERSIESLQVKAQIFFFFKEKIKARKNRKERKTHVENGKTAWHTCNGSPRR